MAKRETEEEMDDLIREIVAPSPPPTKEELRMRAMEDRFIAKYPRILGELRFGDDEESQKGTREPSFVVGLAEAGVELMKEWMGRDMEHIDFAMISPERKPEVLKAMAATGVWVDGKEKKRLTVAQKKLVASYPISRHVAMKKALRAKGYVHWLSIVGRWRSDEGNKTEDTNEHSFFVPNAKRVSDTGSFRDRMKPVKLTELFKQDMLELGRRFTQEAVVLRASGATKLYSTFCEGGKVVGPLDKALRLTSLSYMVAMPFGKVIGPLDKALRGKKAMERFRELYASTGESTRPRATGKNTGVSFLLEVCPFKPVPYNTFMRYSLHGGYLAE